MKKEIKRILNIALIINIVLVLIKLSFGYLGNTISLVSDGYNSLSDVFISVMLLITIKITSKKPDNDHPYGHEKYEGIVSFVLGIILFLTAVYITYEGINGLINIGIGDIDSPKIYTIYVAIISIVLKTVIFILYMQGYKKYNQASFKAEAYNHIGDIFATLASLIGIILTRIGLVYFDYIAALLIGIIIFKNAFVVIKESVSFLVDEAPDNEVMKSVYQTIKNVKGVINIDDLRARKHMNRIYVDVEISVDQSLSLVEAHAIAERVHHLVEKTHKEVIHCMVHFNPSKNM
ncbi:MAG: cation diffusion facilitator family transporter [Acholeplasma sp.]|nr:cation diffusion facilitator family transporter [Acholeplasma sp.]